MGNIRVHDKRLCSKCGSETTSSAGWYHDDNGGSICAKCEQRIYYRSKHPDWRTKADITAEIKKRVCIECGSNVTRISYRQKSAYELWYDAEQYGMKGWLCDTCRRRVRRHLGLDKPGNTPKVTTMSLGRRLKRRAYMREYMGEMRRADRQKFRNNAKLYNIMLKVRLMKILDQACCVYCGYAIFPALQFDHKNSFGNKDALRFQFNTVTMKRYYIKHPEEARKKLDVVCANCNNLKKFHNGEDATLGILPKQLIKLTNSKAPFPSVDFILQTAEPQS